ncbi:hypothetical protein CKQ90_33090 [Klebsiella pneumoniae]|nr:hypothetical protein CKQ90_33090 [Klebsiella pneumoniae]
MLSYWLKLAQKEEEAKELTVQVEALEIVVTAFIAYDIPIKTGLA